MKHIKKILIIDDEQSVRRAFELALEDTEYKVVTVSSGEKGIEEVKNNIYHLIFIDLKMPHKNGVRTLYGIRELNFNVPVYIITSFDKDFLEELDEARRANIQFQIIRKPIGSFEILALTQSVLDSKIEY